MNENKNENENENENDILRLSQIKHFYQQGTQRIDVLRGIDLCLQARQLVALTGPSGSGKSTLLHLAGLLEHPQEGQIYLIGKDISKANDKQRTKLRRTHIGFVYQFHNLLPEFTALENIMLPMRIAGRHKEAARARAHDLLAQLDLTDRANHLPGEMSGGEQQRIAIARALANKPSLVLADEPTGSLDPRIGAHVFDIFMQTAREQGAAALIATHNQALATLLDQQFILEDGKLK